MKFKILAILTVFFAFGAVHADKKKQKQCYDDAKKAQADAIAAAQKQFTPFQNKLDHASDVLNKVRARLEQFRDELAAAKNSGKTDDPAVKQKVQAAQNKVDSHMKLVQELTEKERAALKDRNAAQKEFDKAKGTANSNYGAQSKRCATM